MDVCLHVQSHKLVHVSGMCILYKWLCFCVHYQRKDEKRQKEEVSEELKRFMMQEMAGGFYLFEEAPSV